MSRLLVLDAPALVLLLEDDSVEFDEEDAETIAAAIATDDNIDGDVDGDDAAALFPMVRAASDMHRLVARVTRGLCTVDVFAVFVAA
jgi:hypothetical protein